MQICIAGGCNWGYTIRKRIDNPVPPTSNTKHRYGEMGLMIGDVSLYIVADDNFQLLYCYP